MKKYIVIRKLKDKKMKDATLSSVSSLIKNYKNQIEEISNECHEIGIEKELKFNEVLKMYDEASKQLLDELTKSLNDGKRKLQSERVDYENILEIANQ